MSSRPIGAALSDNISPGRVGDIQELRNLTGKMQSKLETIPANMADVDVRIGLVSNVVDIIGRLSASPAAPDDSETADQVKEEACDLSSCLVGDLPMNVTFVNYMLSANSYQIAKAIFIDRAWSNDTITCLVSAGACLPVSLPFRPLRYRDSVGPGSSCRANLYKTGIDLQIEMSKKMECLEVGQSFILQGKEPVLEGV